ncbi:MAG: hypothetical protein D5S00_10105 [Tindallia sp. MSAO_Bac2]|nr:MAG: hypothetical protein D5S00_10105 [Tindallia sp. MSAO_Bac2]
MERIKTIIDQEEAIEVVKQYSIKKKKGDFEIKRVEEVNIPYYILHVEMSIKRAFGLKPKVIEHVYWVNAIDGEMIRTKEEPEYESINSGRLMKQQLNKKQCAKIAEEQAFKHVTRFYKSFWTPEISVEEKEHICIGYWMFVLKFENKEEEKILLVNTFSGDVTGHLQQEQEVYKKVI